MGFNLVCRAFREGKTVSQIFLIYEVRSGGHYIIQGSVAVRTPCCPLAVMPVYSKTGKKVEARFKGVLG